MQVARSYFALIKLLTSNEWQALIILTHLVCILPINFGQFSSIDIFSSVNKPPDMISQQKMWSL